MESKVTRVTGDSAAAESARLPAPARAEFAVGNLSLRLLTAADWPLEQALSRWPDVVRWTTLPPDLSEEQARARVDRGITVAAEGRLARYVIVEGGVAVGTCGVGAVDGEVEVFYAVLPEGRGRGVASRAATTLAHWARDAGAEAVTLLTYPDNLASQRVAARAGFAPDGEQVRGVKGVEVSLFRWRLTD